MIKKLIIGFITLGLTAQAIAEVKKAPSLEPIYQEIQLCNSDTLLLLDIAGTLVVHPDPVMHIGHDQWKSTWFKQNCPNPSKEDIIALELAVLNSPWRLVENWPDLINNGQNRKIKVIALSRVFMDPYLDDFRIPWLAQKGLIFHDSLPELTGRWDLFSYSNGIIHTGEKRKGPVFAEILRQLKTVPRKVIFVDDRIEQIESVEAACKDACIPFIGFHYTAFETVPDLDESVANMQLQILVKEHKWIPSKDAINLITP